MCGIAGKIYFSNQREVSLSELDKMTNVIEHRGPDDKGSYVNKNIGLGFRRLSIIDLESGHQPLSDASKSSWITFNGEIYNFKELRKTLQGKGYTFNTGSDTEVIVNLYEEYGEECVNHLRGMFGFVIWDTKKQQLFGARDRFGIKPFHYYIDDEKFVWGSEMKSILNSEDINKSIDLESLDYFFAYGYTPRDKTIYNTIKKIKPGHCFVLKPGEKSLNIKKYWDVSYTPDYTMTKADWKEKIYTTLEESVKMRMVSDVPLGAFLSGGIDSSIVVSLMALNSSNSIKTFSIGFKEEKYNELKYARLIADKYNTDHHEFIVEPESIDLLPKLVQGYDEPFADSSSIPTYYVSKYTREYVTVALSGDGGDELFAGYNSYQKQQELLNKKVDSKFFFNLVNKMIPDYFYGKGISYYRSKEKQDIAAYFCFWKDYERRKIFNKEIQSNFAKNYSENLKIDLLKSYKGDFLSKNQMLDMQTYMVDDVLTKVDRASMLNSLEVRVPILDHEFAELSFKIPTELKLNNGDKKHILKETFKDILPSEIISHKKQGFSVPLNVWFKSNLRDYSYDTLLNSSRLYEFLDKKYVKEVLDNHQKGVRDFSQKIWSLLFLNEWLIQNDK